MLLPDASQRPVEEVIVRWDLSSATVWIQFEGDQPSWDAFVDRFPQFVHPNADPVNLDPFAGLKPEQPKNGPVP